MNDESRREGQGAACVLDATAVRAFRDRLDDEIATDDPLQELRAIDELRNALSARAARLVVAAHDAQEGRDVPRGVTRDETRRLIGVHVGFARRCSPREGSAFVAVAHALVDDMPHALEALTAGILSETEAARLTRETAALSGTDRSAVDVAIAPLLGTASSQQLIRAVREQAYELDPETIRQRRLKAESDRRVSVRPGPDCMAFLTALLPVKDALACQAVLSAAADESDAPRGQVMADTLVQRVTGRAHAQANLDVCVDLLMPWDTLTGEAPAHLPGYGPVPADLAREWIGTGDPTGPRIRRLFTQPGTGDIVGMDSRARRYPGLLAMLILLRDQVCRAPWCGAPIRHTDHIRSHAAGGATTERNGQGFCARCNYIKEHPDYQVSGDAGETTTHTAGFTARSRPPAPPGLPPPTGSHPERLLMDIIWKHTVSQHAIDRGDPRSEPDRL